MKAASLICGEQNRGCALGQNHTHQQWRHKIIVIILLLNTCSSTRPPATGRLFLAGRCDVRWMYALPLYNKQIINPPLICNKIGFGGLTSIQTTKVNGITPRTGQISCNRSLEFTQTVTPGILQVGALDVLDLEGKGTIAERGRILPITNHIGILDRPLGNLDELQSQEDVKWEPKIEVRFNMDTNIDFNDNTSRGYIDLKNEIGAQMFNRLTGGIAELEAVVVESLRRGSVIAYCRLVMNTTGQRPDVALSLMNFAGQTVTLMGQNVQIVLQFPSQGSGVSDVCDVHKAIYPEVCEDKVCKIDGVEPTCVCEPGFREMSTVNTTCVDVDECSENCHCCDQVCTNTIGSFNCGCNPGYILDSDSPTCNASPLTRRTTKATIITTLRLPPTTMKTTTTATTPTTTTTTTTPAITLTSLILPSQQTSYTFTAISTDSTLNQYTEGHPPRGTTEVPAALIGGIVGAVVGLVIAVTVVIYIVRRKKGGKTPEPDHPAACDTEDRADRVTTVNDNDNTTDGVTPAAEGDRDPASTTDNIYEIIDDSDHYYAPLSNRDNTYVNDNTLYTTPVFTKVEEGGVTCGDNAVHGSHTTYYNTSFDKSYD